MIMPMIESAIIILKKGKNINEKQKILKTFKEWPEWFIAKREQTKGADDNR